MTIDDVIKCPEISFHTISIDVTHKGSIEKVINNSSTLFFDDLNCLCDIKRHN